jgi:hypothetical protein
MKQLFLRGTTSATTVIMVIWGYVDMASFLFEKLILPWAITVSTLILVLVLASVFLLPGFTLLRRLGARPFETERIYVEYSRTTTVKSDFSAVVENTRKIVFFKDPRKKDLWDSFTVAEGESLNNLPYQSPDADEIGRRQKDRSKVNVYWWPKQPLIPKTVYQHTTTTVPPFKYNDKCLYSEFLCVGDVGIFTETIIPPFRPAEVVAFPSPRFKKLKSGEKIILYALQQARKIDGLQPQVRTDGSIFWKIEGPTRGKTYILLALSAEENKRWQRRANEG